MSKLSKIVDMRSAPRIFTALSIAVFPLVLACDRGFNETNAVSASKEDQHHPSTAIGMTMHPRLQSYIRDVATRFAEIPEERRQQLDKLASFVQSKRRAGEVAKITYICTHNSRRSHMGQLWAAAAATYYGVEGVETYSGGTEATAFNPRAVASLQRAGFEIESEDAAAENPHYRVGFMQSGPQLEAFSKRYDAPPNPQKDFAAVMTCTQADKSCPIVAGASLRVALPYEDPKAADGTPQEAETYDARAHQIATEMFYLFSKVRA